MHFLTTLFEPVVLAYIAANCLLGFAVPGYRTRNDPQRVAGTFEWIFWLLIGVLAILAIIIFYVT